VIDMLIEDRELARKNGQSSAAIRATELIGIELGMFVKQTDNRHRVEKRFTDLSPEEQEKAWIEVTEKAKAVIARARLIEAQKAKQEPVEVEVEDGAE
jgi:hypothetical protein